ncbi:hypothetical protein X777_05884, partial [Ooceraea biroi]
GAKTNILEDYKLMQDTLRKKLDMQNQMLIHEREQVKENLGCIERKFKIDREKYSRYDFCFILLGKH